MFYYFLRSNCCKKLTLTLLTHISPKHTIVSIEINNFLYKWTIKGQFKVNLVDFYFCALGTNGLKLTRFKISFFGHASRYYIYWFRVHQWTFLALLATMIRIAAAVDCFSTNFRCVGSMSRHICPAYPSSKGIHSFSFINRFVTCLNMLHKVN